MKDTYNLTLTLEQLNSISFLIDTTEIYRNIQIQTWNKITKESDGQYKLYAQSCLDFLESKEADIIDVSCLIRQSRHDDLPF